MSKKSTKTFTVILTVIFTFIVLALSFNGRSYDPIRFYNRSAEMNGIKKMFIDTMIVSSGGNAFTVDISSAGFNHVFTAAAIPMRNTSTMNQMATSNLKSLSTTSAVFNVTQPSFSVVTILGIDVLAGSGVAFVSPNTVTLQVIVLGD